MYFWMIHYDNRESSDLHLSSCSRETQHLLFVACSNGIVLADFLLCTVDMIQSQLIYHEKDFWWKHLNKILNSRYRQISVTAVLIHHEICHVHFWVWSPSHADNAMESLAECPLCQRTSACPIRSAECPNTVVRDVLAWFNFLSRFLMKNVWSKH